MTPPPASSDETPEADFARPVLERQLARLERLADIGMEIAEALGRRVAEDETLDPAAATLAFGRVSRAVRMTCALQTEVIDKLRGVGRIEAYEAESAAEIAAREAAQAAADLRLRARKLEIAEGVADAIDEAHETTEGRERCAREARERLRDANDLGDILSRPVDEVITQICRELGIARGLSSLTSVHPDDREAEARSSQPRDPGVFSSTAARRDRPPPDLAQEKTWVPTFVGMNQNVEQPPPTPAYQPPPDPDALPGYPVGLPGELPPDRRSRPRPPPRNYTYGWD